MTSHLDLDTLVHSRLAPQGRPCGAAGEHPDWTPEQIEDYCAAELAETVEPLQASAFELLDRMIDAKVSVDA